MDERSEDFGATVAQILVLVPTYEVTPQWAGAFSVIAWQSSRRAKLGLEWLESGWQRIDERYVVATFGGDKVGANAHACTTANMPGAVVVATHVAVVVHAFVGAFDEHTA